MTPDLIRPNTVIPFAATGLVSVAANGGSSTVTLRLRPYAVMPDGRVFMVSSEAEEGSVVNTRLDPVPATAQASIKEAHPEMRLRFPQVTTRRPPMDVDDQLVQVDPMRLNRLYGGAEQIPHREMVEAGGQVLEGNWDVALPHLFTEIDNFQALRARVKEGVPWETTRLYRRVVREIESGKVKWGCRTEEQFRRRCASLDRLYERIRDEGYKTQAELGTARPGDEVRIAVARDGRLIFVDGRHRLAIARILQLPSIPVRIVARHAEWQRFKEELLEYADRYNGRIYQQIDHPDLADIPAHHTTERIEILRRALNDYDPRGKKVLDIGAHWGYMSQQLGKLGFDCTAVEASPNNRRIAEALAVATEAAYRVWEGDLLDYPNPEEADVVLALNIFHHLTKTEQGHEGLIAFLGRLSADRILFEPHRHDPPGQMEGAYRNYGPQEFAEFVARHAGMSTVKQLGQANDGRLLFSIT